MKEPINQQNTYFKLEILWVLGVVVIAGAVYAGMKLQERKQALSPSQTINQESASPTTEPTVDKTADWKTFTSERISFKYPESLTLEERQKNFFCSSLRFPESPKCVYVN